MADLPPFSHLLKGLEIQKACPPLLKGSLEGLGKAALGLVWDGHLQGLFQRLKKQLSSPRNIPGCHWNISTHLSFTDLGKGSQGCCYTHNVPGGKGHAGKWHKEIYKVALGKYAPPPHPSQFSHL